MYAWTIISTVSLLVESFRHFVPEIERACNEEEYSWRSRQLCHLQFETSVLRRECVHSTLIGAIISTISPAALRVLTWGEIVIHSEAAAIISDKRESVLADVVVVSATMSPLKSVD